MNEDPGAPYELQFATVDLRVLYNQKDDSGNHIWDLCANIIFGDEEIETSVGTISVSINRATFVIELEGCEMDAMDAGYQRQMRESRQQEVERVTQHRYQTSGTLSAIAKLRPTKATARLEAGGEIKGNTRTQRNEVEAWGDVSDLVTFVKKRPDGSLQWKIQSVDGLALLGTAVGYDDSERGVLGKIKSTKDGGWLVKPKVEFVTDAQMVTDRENLTPGQRKAESRAKKADQKRSMQLGIIGAMVNKTVKHVELPSLTNEEANE